MTDPTTRPDDEPHPTITLDFDTALSILDALRNGAIYTLLGSEKEHLLGGEDENVFKPWKWTGYEEEQAEKEVQAYRDLLRAMCTATGTPFVEADEEQAETV